MKLLLVLALLISSGFTIAETYPVSDHYDGSRFFDPKGPGLKGFWDLVKWKTGPAATKWPESVDNKTYTLPTPEAGSRGYLTFINHATFLIQLENLTVLTDPIFSQRAGPFESFGPVKRSRAPGIPLESLPPVDVVLVSHNHYDHLDIESLKLLDAKMKPLFLVPLGDRELLIDAGLQNVKEMDWWGMQEVKGAKIIFTPVQHWSARGLFDKNKSLWGGFMIEMSGKRIYFAGDTGYTTYFKETRDKLGVPDIALLPIGAYEPRWFMKDHHMNPEESLQAHRDLGAKVSFGMHYGTFQLTDEGIDTPLEELKIAREKGGVSSEEFRILDFGESWKLP